MEIKQITEQNPWWQEQTKILEDEKVKQALSKKHPLIPQFKPGNFLLTGPRQVGKTTYLKLLVKQLIEDKINPQQIIYFSCEPLKSFSEIIDIVRFTDSLNSLKSGEKYFFFDEITFVPEWQKAVKYILDSPLKEGKTFYITGSSTLALKKETFPGRDLIIQNFLPLSFPAFCQIFADKKLRTELDFFKIKDLSAVEVYQKCQKSFFYFSEISQLFNQYLQAGGFPKSFYELIEGQGISEETYEIYWKWLISDIAKIERSERITESILISVLKNYGSRFSLNSVAAEMEIGSHVTIRDYLEILEDLFVLRNIFPFDPKKQTEIFRKMRKVYFIDPFLFSVFKKTLTKQSVEEKEIPHIIEGIVSGHLARHLGRVYYFSGKKEVDFIVSEIKKFPILKYNSLPTAREPKASDYIRDGHTGLEVKWQRQVNFSDFPKVDLPGKIILSKSEFAFDAEQNILIVPVSLFLLCLE